MGKKGKKVPGAAPSVKAKGADVGAPVQLIVSKPWLDQQLQQGCCLGGLDVHGPADRETGTQGQLLGSLSTSAQLLEGSTLYMCLQIFSPVDFHPAWPERGVG